MGKYGNIDGIATLTNDSIAVENIRRLKANAIKEMEKITAVPADFFKSAGLSSVSGHAMRQLCGTKK